MCNNFLTIWVFSSLMRMILKYYFLVREKEHPSRALGHENYPLPFSDNLFFHIYLCTRFYYLFSLITLITVTMVLGMEFL